MNACRSSVVVASIALTLSALLGSSAAAAQVVWPEGELQALPDDGCPLTLTLPAQAPLVVASTDKPDGSRTHALVWESGLGQRSWLYARAQLTFFATARGGPVTLRVVDGAVTATGPGVRSLVWPDAVESWSFSDVGPLPRSRARLFHLSVSTGSGCPSTVSDHWLKLDAGALTTLLRTGGTGEGGGDAAWFSGTTVVWPEALTRESKDATGVKLEAAFPALQGVPAAQRVVVYDVDLVEGALRRAHRVVYRLAQGRLQRVRKEQADPAALTPAPESSKTTQTDPVPATTATPTPTTAPPTTAPPTTPPPTTAPPTTAPPTTAPPTTAPPTTALARAPFDATPPRSVRILAITESTPTSIVTQQPVADGFVACSDGVLRPLGKALGVEVRQLGAPESGGPAGVDHHRFASPCPRPLFLMQGPGVHAAPFSILPGLAAPEGGRRFGDVVFQATRDTSSNNTVACTITRGTARQTVHGFFGVCSLLFSGDLNGDGVVDFLVEHMAGDPCLARTLLLSSGDRWQRAGTNTTWCPG